MIYVCCKTKSKQIKNYLRAFKRLFTAGLVDRLMINSLLVTLFGHNDLINFVTHTDFFDFRLLVKMYKTYSTQFVYDDQN